jgi:hypothetical protein
LDNKGTSLTDTQNSGNAIVYLPLSHLLFHLSRDIIRKAIVVVIDRLCGLVVKSYWLQIRRPGFDSRNYQKKKVVGLERGPLSLVSITGELLDRKVATPV